MTWFGKLSAAKKPPPKNGGFFVRAKPTAEPDILIE
jgi:hypothetical protein